MNQYIRTNYNQTIAYNKFDGKKIGIIFLGGFKSDMTGQKAIEIENWAKENNHSFIRFDYTGHGRSSGNINDLVFSDWLKDTIYIIKNLTLGPQILVGSSMGGWIALSIIKKHITKIKSLVCIAAAPDFPKLLIWDKLKYFQKKQLLKNKKIVLKKFYDEEEYEYVITYKFIKDCLSNLVMDEKIEFKGKVFLYHGMKDEDVPYETSFDISRNIIGTEQTQIILEKKGEHRLSKKNEINTILKLLKQSA